MGVEEKDLLTRIIEIEEEYFPEMSGANAVDADICGYDSDWMLFSAKHYLDRGVLTPSFLHRVSEGGLLSVGAGPAYLERTLVHLGVLQEKMVLTDIEDTMPQSFVKYQFDMHKQWPVIGNFAVVLLPQSNLHFRHWIDEEVNAENQVHHYGKLFRRALKRTTSDGEVIISDGSLPFIDIINDAMVRIRDFYPGAGYEYSNEHVLRLFPVASRRPNP